MIFSRSRNPIVHYYDLGDVVLDCVSNIRDLGIYFDPALRFTDHITRIRSKSLQMLGFLKKIAADFHSVNAMSLLHFSLVRPHLEYASCVWSPYYNIYIGSIEQVQHEILRFMAIKMNVE